MGLFDQFTYTNFHELNLEWVIEHLKKLEDVYDNLQKEIQDTIDFVNNFEEHADQLIDERIAVQLSLYTQRLNDLQNQIDEIVNELNKDNGILGMITDLQNKIDQLQLQLNNLSHLLAKEIFDLEQLMHQYKHDMDQVVESMADQLEDYIVEKVTKIDRLDVVNPITGVFENIQNVIDDIYNIVARSYGLTAGQYDSLTLAALEYDTKFVSAYDYDTKGYFDLYQRLTFAIVRSPFTGLMVPFQTVLDQLANLHKCALTAQEYDNMSMTAEQYDKMLLTAFSYDWFGFQVARLVTAANYDSLNLEASKYDAKMLTASQYERGMSNFIDTQLSGCNHPCGDYNILASQITSLQAEVAKLKSQVG